MGVRSNTVVGGSDYLPQMTKPELWRVLGGTDDAPSLVLGGDQWQTQTDQFCSDKAFAEKRNAYPLLRAATCFDESENRLPTLKKIVRLDRQEIERWGRLCDKLSGEPNFGFLGWKEALHDSAWLREPANANAIKMLLHLANPNRSLEEVDLATVFSEGRFRSLSLPWPLNVWFGNRETASYLADLELGLVQ